MALKLKHDGKDIEIRFTYMNLADFPDTRMRFITINGLGNVPLEDCNRKCSVAELCINDKPLSIGLAVCHPKDNFSKIRGRKIALAKALEPLDKLMRRAVWDTYKEFMKI